MLVSPVHPKTAFRKKRFQNQNFKIWQRLTLFFTIHHAAFQTGKLVQPFKGRTPEYTYKGHLRSSHLQPEPEAVARILV